MSFAVAAESYDRFMGRYSMPLAPRFLDFARVDGGPVLDVGCGPGALTSALVERFGEDAVAAADPSESFVAAARERHPGVRVELAAAEELPFDDGEFAAALAQLVVHFMTDAVAGLREMARVTREGGVVAACVWDLASPANPLGTVWQAAQQLDPGLDGEAERAGATEGHLGELFRAAGLRDVEDGVVSRRASARLLRRVVGTLHARRRPIRAVRGGPRRGCSNSAARPVPRAPSGARRSRSPCAPGRLAGSSSSS